MTPYDKLKQHLTRHVYKKGQFKGDAPADASRRGRSYVRVRSCGDGTMRVRMHGTDLLTAYQDGTVVIDTRGWYDRPTTRLRLNEALRYFIEPHVSLSFRRIFSQSQPVLSIQGKHYSYHDGIKLNEHGEVLTPLVPFEQKRIDKAEVKEFTDGIKSSGFKDAFALLYATVTSDEVDAYSLFGSRVPEVFTDNTYAERWAPLIAHFKYQHVYNFHNGWEWAVRRDAKQVWATIMTMCKKNMYVVSRSSTYVL